MKKTLSRYVKEMKKKKKMDSLIARSNNDGLSKETPDRFVH